MSIPNMTVGELRAALEKLPQDARVQVWLPGCYIDLHQAFESKGRVLLEGNVAEGSAP